MVDSIILTFFRTPGLLSSWVNISCDFLEINPIDQVRKAVNDTTAVLVTLVELTGETTC